jgi:hypothetical protein
MAVLAIFTGNNVTKQMYESLRKEVDWEHNHPTGGILHAAAFDDSSNNIHIADVWKSKEDLNRFVNEKLMPAMQKFKVPTPQVEIFQIHNIHAYHDIDNYMIK